jgi:hypothetical protein
VNEEEYEELLSAAPEIAKAIDDAMKRKFGAGMTQLEYGKILFEYILNNSRS